MKGVRGFVLRQLPGSRRPPRTVPVLWNKKSVASENPVTSSRSTTRRGRPTTAPASMPPPRLHPGCAAAGGIDVQPHSTCSSSVSAPIAGAGDAPVPLDCDAGSFLPADVQAGIRPRAVARWWAVLFFLTGLARRSLRVRNPIFKLSGPHQGGGSSGIGAPARRACSARPPVPGPTVGSGSLDLLILAGDRHMLAF